MRAAGDALLVTVAKRPRRCLCPGGLAWHLGSDQFVLLREGIEAEQTLGIARRQLPLLRNRCALAELALLIAASIGMASACGLKSELMT